MKRFALLGVALLCGCAGTGGGDCGPDWRALGQRDGRMDYGRQQMERYAARCGTPVDRAAYEQGYGEGFAQRRVSAAP
jgi:hypothetical protein